MRASNRAPAIAAASRRTAAREPAPRRVGMIGARRRRNGLGPFAAEHLRAAGAVVPCFLATSGATRDEAARQLAGLGIDARGYLDLDAMLADERLDALAILCPAEAHEFYLEAAAAVGLHTVCEKPLVWGMRDPARAAARIADRFDDRELALWENCQWPYVLPAFEALHPGALAEPPTRFEMRLEPATRGAHALGDMLPHALSLLQATVPGRDARVRDVRFSTRAPDAARIRCEFEYATDAASTRVRIDLERSDRRPRRIAFAFDGRHAERRVDPTTWTQEVVDGDRRAPLTDPFGRLLADFVSRLPKTAGDAPLTRTTEIRERMNLLAAIVGAFHGGRTGSDAL